MRFPACRLGLVAAAVAIGLAYAGPTLGVESLAPAGRAAADAGKSTTRAALSVDLAKAPKQSAADVARMLSPPRPRGGLSEQEYERGKDEAARGQGVVTKPAPPPFRATAGRETPGASPAFAGLGQVGSIRPSDMALAVSKSFVVQVVNSSITVTNKSGVTQSGYPKSLFSLFPGSTGDLGDPRAFYDWGGNRFVVVADDFTGGRIWMAASATSNPLGVWRITSYNVWGAANCRVSGQACADFPMLGFDDSTIYLGLNFFPAAGGVSDFMLLLPKAKIYAGTGFGFNFWFNLRFGSTLVDTVQPVTLLTPSEHPRAGFAVNSFNINFGGVQCRTGCNGLGVWAFSNNLQAAGSPGPELSGIIIPTATTYRLPARANEPGCAGCIDTNDPRIAGTPTYHAGVISASLNTNGSDSRAHVLWFQVVPVLNDNDARCTGAFLNRCPQVTSASLLNEDCYFCGGQGAAGSTYYGALAPDNGGDLTMVFIYSDNNLFPGSAYVSRRVTQAKNTMHDAGIFLCTGQSLYSLVRFGDYSAAVGDISNASQGFMWFSAMSASTGGRWGSCIGRNGFTSPAQPHPDLATAK